MSKNRHSAETKVRACQQYITGRKSALQLAIELKLGKGGNKAIMGWAQWYKAYGSTAFYKNGKNNSYSKDFKLKVVREYLDGKVSMRGLAVKYNISCHSVIERWIKKYNSHIELKDYDPKPEVYMAKTLKTTLEERVKIVKYCLEHDRDIKGTALIFGCNYAQLYPWIKKYEANGVAGLEDKRGKRKLEDELSELEKAQRKIAQLEREKEEYRRCYELLKKAGERERW